MVFIACVGQTHYKSICGRVLPQAVNMRGSGEYCSVDYVLYLVPAIYSLNHRREFSFQTPATSV